MNILLILLLSTGAGRRFTSAGRQQLGRWLGPAPLGHHPEGGQHGRTGRHGACRSWHIHR